MRHLLVLGLLALAGCTEASATRVSEGTYTIESPPCFTCGTGTNERLATKVCHDKGYYIVSSESHKGGSDRATDETNPITVWKIHCIE